MKEITDLLNLDKFPDLLTSENGCVAIYRPEISKMSFGVIVNKPNIKFMEKIVDLADPSRKETVKEIYMLCNGMRVDKFFSVLGIPTTIYGSQAYTAYHIPSDFNHPNIYMVPEGFPENGIIVATSKASESGAEFHTVEPGGYIFVRDKFEFSSILRQYHTVRDWLASEFQLAVSKLNK